MFCTNLVEADTRFLATYERLVLQVVLPALKERLAAAAPARFGPRAPPTRFFYQLPPTIRLQPGPSQRCVRAHSDSAYGHQPGELNCWMPLTSPARTRTTLWLESADYGLRALSELNHMARVAFPFP